MLASTIGIRWLAGGSCIDIRHAYRCSIASVHRCQDLFLDSVLNCADLKIVFAETRGDLIKLSTAFEEKNKAGLLRGCVSAIDGFQAKISRTMLCDCGNNPGSFYSDHYTPYTFLEHRDKNFYVMVHM